MDMKVSYHFWKDTISQLKPNIKASMQENLLEKME